MMRLERTRGIGVLALWACSCGVMAQPLLLSGQVTSMESQSLVVPKPGDAWRYQIQWMLPEGEMAQAGQPVVIFDKSQLDNQIEQLEANVERVTAQEQSRGVELEVQVLQARFNLKKAALDKDKAALDAAVPAEFIAAKTYADNQFRLMRSEHELAKMEQALFETESRLQASLKQLTLDRDKADIALTQARDGIDELTLFARFSGPVLYGFDHRANRKYDVGDSIQIGRTVATIPSTDRLLVKAWVNEVDVDRLELNQSVTLQLDAALQQTLPGHIAGIGRQAERRRGWGVGNWFEVEVQFDAGLEQAMVPGMSVLIRTGEGAQ
ncbi:HlyD family secretion protein [Ferrimonas pelagia]|uniref:HlyD family efflux transporter periplasmic adaptor subunit n=1 Tax=Ferrimonas pelagia TaxID=1177826 RepID=A0ABP9EWH6_9GAMM